MRTTGVVLAAAALTAVVAGAGANARGSGLTGLVRVPKGRIGRVDFHLDTGIQ